VRSPRGPVGEYWRAFRKAMDTSLGPLLESVGFEGSEGTYVTQWSDLMRLQVFARESKWNRFQSEQFRFYLDGWVVDSSTGFVRWMWQSNPVEWQIDSPAAANELPHKLIEAVVESALPLARDTFGRPIDNALDRLTGNRDLDKARRLGSGYLKSPPPDIEQRPK
jgi:hypothetical protein